MPNYDEPRPKRRLGPGSAEWTPNAPPGGFTPISSMNPNPWLGRQSAEGYQAMLPSMAAGPGQAFSPEQLSGLHSQGMNQLQANTQQSMAGGQMAQNARGAAGPDLATLLGGQTDAANRGALAQGDLQAQLQGLELGNQQYQAQGQVFGQMGGLAQGYAQLGEESRQFDSELAEAMRQFDSAQTHEEKMSHVQTIQGMADAASAAYNDYIQEYADSMTSGNLIEAEKYSRLAQQMQFRKTSAENQLYALMGPSMRDPLMGAIGGTAQQFFEQNPSELFGAATSNDWLEQFLPGIRDMLLPGGLTPQGLPYDWTRSRTFDGSTDQINWGQRRFNQEYYDPRTEEDQRLDWLLNRPGRGSFWDEIYGPAGQQYGTGVGTGGPLPPFF
jgi:hypothetical protein